MSFYDTKLTKELTISIKRMYTLTIFILKSNSFIERIFLDKTTPSNS
jgi:hypothetical protein